MNISWSFWKIVKIGPYILSVKLIKKKSVQNEISHLSMKYIPPVSVTACQSVVIKPPIP